MSKRIEALDRKINYRTSFNPRPYYPKGKGKKKGQCQIRNQNKKEESENKSKTDKFESKREENRKEAAFKLIDVSVGGQTGDIRSTSSPNNNNILDHMVGKENVGPVIINGI